MTSDSFTAPTEPWMTLSLTSSVDSRSSDSVRASTEPCTSALRMRRSSLTSPDSICLCSSSRVMRAEPLPLSFSRSARTVAICRALRSSATTSRVSPAWGTPESPRISTGSAGPAFCAFLPRSLNMARTRPDCEPTTTASPSLSVPDWIRAVATGPRPRSSRPSTITPRAARFGLALSSRISDWSAVISSSCGMPSPRFAEVWTKMVCPPQSSGTSPWLDELALDAVRLGARLVDLVHRHDDGHLGGLGVVHRLHRLRHHAVVGRHHQDDDVGGLGAARPHGGEGLVARRVEEGHLAVARVHLVGADVLGDAARLLLGHARLADGVEERGLAVVDVAHDGDHRRPRLELGRIGLLLFEHVALERADLHVEAELVRDQLGRGGIEHLVQRGHHAQLEEGLDHLARLPAHRGGQLAHRDRLGQLDELALDLDGRLGRRGRDGLGLRGLDGGRGGLRRTRRRRGRGGARGRRRHDARRGRQRLARRWRRTGRGAPAGAAGRRRRDGPLRRHAAARRGGAAAAAGRTGGAAAGRIGSTRGGSITGGRGARRLRRGAARSPAAPRRRRARSRRVRPARARPAAGRKMVAAGLTTSAMGAGSGSILAVLAARGLARRLGLRGLGLLALPPGRPWAWARAWAWPRGQLAPPAELDPQLVGGGRIQRRHRPLALVAHAVEGQQEILAGDAQLLRQVNDLQTSRQCSSPLPVLFHRSSISIMRSDRRLGGAALNA